MINVIWFRNDLRIHDNPSLLAAEKNGLPTLCIYSLPKQNSDYYGLGFKRNGSFKHQFLIESILDLKRSLKKLDGDLLICNKEIDFAIKVINDQYKVQNIFYQAEIAFEEKQEEAKVISFAKENDCKVVRHFNSVLYDVNKLPFHISNTPDVFTIFRKKVEQQSQIEKPLPNPQSINFLKTRVDFSQILQSVNEIELEENLVANPIKNENSAFPFSGGERNGLSRIDEYLFKTRHLSSYKETRNNMIGTEYSSKFSAWLANGSLSPRYVVNEIKRFETEVEKNESTYWLIFELLWREYWRYVFIKHGSSYFKINGIAKTEKNWKTNRVQFEKWRIGKTGFPLVDSNMRELFQTGWMSNRGRQITASFLAKNLEIDWRWGAAWFESQLIDYDVYSNWGNWAYVAGVGNDGRDRYFNLQIQAKNYDSNGEYMKIWCPELKEISGETLGVIHQLSETERKLFNLDKTNYPQPIIDLEASYQKLNQKK